MGTRHLVCVKFNQEYKVSQFGSMGGQPQGAGVGCLNHLKSIVQNLEKYKQQLSLVELVQYNENDFYNPEVQTAIPAHTILKLIHETNKTIKFYPSIEYAGDCSCDWVYVVDLDDNSFKVYKGKNKDADKEEKDFTQYIPEKNLDYRAVALFEKYALNALPDPETFKAYHDRLEREEDERLNAE